MLYGPLREVRPTIDYRGFSSLIMMMVMLVPLARTANRFQGLFKSFVCLCKIVNRLLDTFSCRGMPGLPGYCSPFCIFLAVALIVLQPVGDELLQLFYISVLLFSHDPRFYCPGLPYHRENQYF